MGMMDQKRYLTGDNGILKVGDTFHLHGAKVVGEVNTPNGRKPEAALRVSKHGTEEPIVVFTTGAAIVGQVGRLDQEDTRRMESSGGWAVRLDAIDTGQGNPAHIIAPQDDNASQGQTPGAAAGF